jgi:hypothetical protein
LFVVIDWLSALFQMTEGLLTSLLTIREWMLVLKVRLVEVTGGGERILPGGGRGCRVDIGASGDDSVPFSTTGEYRNSCPAARVRGVILPFISVHITSKKQKSLTSVLDQGESGEGPNPKDDLKLG